MAFDMRLMSKRFLTDGMLPEAGVVERLTTLLGRPLRSYRDFVTGIVASAQQPSGTAPTTRSIIMIYSTATVPVNPEGEAQLTRTQAWKGLILKARDARLFLPPGLCTRCEVVEESAAHLVREATIAGQDLREIIIFEPEGKVTFFQAAGPREGAIINELFEDEAGALQLRFYCYLGLRGKEPGGLEERAEQTQFDSDKGYRSALLSTLKRTRELLAKGQI